MIIDASKKLKFERFLMPNEKLKCINKKKGLKKGKEYNIISYIPDLVLIKNNKGIHKWYSTKNFKKV